MGQAQGGLQLPSCLGRAAQGLQHPHSDRTAQKPQRLAAPIAEGRLLGFQPKIQTLLPGFRSMMETLLRTHRGIILSTRFIFEADNPDLRCLEVEGVRTGMILVWKEREPQGPLRQLIRAFPTTEDPPSDPAERKGPMPISGIEQPGTIPIARDLRLRRYDIGSGRERAEPSAAASSAGSQPYEKTEQSWHRRKVLSFLPKSSPRGVCRRGCFFAFYAFCGAGA